MVHGLSRTALGARPETMPCFRPERKHFARIPFRGWLSGPRSGPQRRKTSRKDLQVSADERLRERVSPVTANRHSASFRSGRQGSLPAPDVCGARGVRDRASFVYATMSACLSRRMIRSSWSILTSLSSSIASRLAQMKSWRRFSTTTSKCCMISFFQRSLLS